MPGLLAVVRSLEPNRHFGKLWLSQLLSLTAFNMVNFTLLIKVFELTRSTTLVSLFVLSFGLPSLFFGVIAGVFADRWNRRTVLVVTNLLRTIIVLAYLPALEHLPTIFVATFVMATVTQFFTPAEGALIPQLVERRRLVAANAIFVVTMFASFVLGYGLAGPLAATGGDGLPIAIAAGMFGLATLVCLTLPKLPEVTRRVPLGQAYRDVRRQLAVGWRVVRRSGFLRYGLGQLTFIWSVIGVVMVLLPAFTAEVLGLNLREISRLMILPIGVGMLSGGYLLHRARRQFASRTVVTASLLLAGGAVATLGQVNGLASAVIESGFSPVDDFSAVQQFLTSASATVLGLTISIVMIAAQTLIHEHTTNAVRGRIFGFLGTSVNAANTIPVLAAGALTDLLRVGTVISLVGVLLVGWGVASWRFGRRLSD